VLLDYILILLIISGTKREVIHQKMLLVMDTKLHKCRHKNLAQISLVQVRETTSIKSSSQLDNPPPNPL